MEEPINDSAVLDLPPTCTGSERVLEAASPISLARFLLTCHGLARTIEGVAQMRRYVPYDGDPAVPTRDGYGDSCARRDGLARRAS